MRGARRLSAPTLLLVAAAALLLAAGSAAAQEAFPISALTPQAVFSCQAAQVNGTTNSTGGTPAVTNQGHVVSAAGINVNGGGRIDGNASPGPGFTVTGAGTVTGSQTPLASAPSCAPVALSSLVTSLQAANDNARIGLTVGGQNPLSGTSFTLNGGQEITLAAGQYYFTSFTVNGGATLKTSGIVKILVNGSWALSGNLNAGASDNPSNLRLFTASTGSLSINGGVTFKGYAYAPSATLTNNATVVGGLFAGKVTVNGGSTVSRWLGSVDLGPPTLSITDPTADGAQVADLSSVTVRGVVGDPDGLAGVVVKVNGTSATVNTSNGNYEATISLAGVVPAVVSVTATDPSGNVAAQTRALCGPPPVEVTSPAQGSTVTTQTVTLQGTVGDAYSGSPSVTVRVGSGAAQSATVNAVAHTWSLVSLDLGAATGPKVLTITATAACGTSSVQRTLTYATVPDYFAVGDFLSGQATFSCQTTVLDNGSRTGSVGATGAPTNKGHVLANTTIQVKNNAVVDGDALAGAGQALPTLQNNAVVTGTRGNQAANKSCTPVDVAAAAAWYQSHNDNASIPRTQGNKNPLVGGELKLDNNDTLTLPAGVYYVSKLTLGNNAVLAVNGANGPVRILVTGQISLSNNSRLNEGGSPFDLRIWASGAQDVAIDNNTIPRTFVYAPNAKVVLDNNTVLTGGVFGKSVELKNNAKVYRRLDLSPPVLTILEPTLANPPASLSAVTVRGTVSDPDGNPVAVTVNGSAVAVTGGSFQTVLDVTGVSPAIVTVVATDPTGQTDVEVISLCAQAPAVVLTSPAPNGFVNQRTLTLSGTSGSATAVTVSLNGGAPQNATVDAAAHTFSLSGFDLGAGDGPRTLTVVGSASGCPSSTQNYTITLDTLPPTVSIDTPAAGSTVSSSPVSVSGPVADQNLLAVSVNGTAAGLSSGRFTASVALPNGSSTLTAVATDKAGNSATATSTVNVYAQGPSVTLTPPASLLTGERSLTLTGTVAGAPPLTVTVAGVPATVTGGSFTANVSLAEGPNALTALATDGFSRTATSATVTVELDATPPSVTLDSPASGSCRGADPVTLAGRYADLHPASADAVTVEIRPAGGGAATTALAAVDPAQSRWTLAGASLGSADGTATVTVTAKDALGATSRTLASLRVDVTTPALTWLLDGSPFGASGAGSAPPAGTQPALLGRVVGFRAEVRDGGDAAPPAATLTLDGQPYVEGAAISAEGDHTLVARATDCAGHEGSAWALFRIDRTGAQLLSVTPADGSKTKDPVTSVSGTSDAELASATVNAAAAQLSADRKAFTLSPYPWKEGANALHVVLTDLAGNETAFDRSFTVKTLAPTLEILESGLPLASGSTFFRAVTPTVRTNDAAAALTVTLDAQPFASGTAVSAAGAHTLAATVRDDVGNETQRSVTFTIDLTAGPTLDIAQPADGAVLPGTSVAVSGPTGASTTQVTVNGQAATLAGAGTTSATFAATVPLELDVPNELVAVARDTRGRTAQASRTVLSRSSGPRIVITEPAQGSTTNRSKVDVVGAVVGGPSATRDGAVRVASASASGAPAEVLLDATGAFRAKDVPLVAGVNALTVSAVDKQDRTGSAQVTIQTDLTPPSISLTVDGQPLADDASFGRAITLRVEVSDDSTPVPAPAIRLNGQDRPASGPLTQIAIAEAGGYVVDVVARDAAGNETRAAKSFVVDLGGCSLSDTHPAEGEGVSAASVTIHGKSGGARSVSVEVPNPGTSPVTYQSYPALVSDGTFAVADVPLPAVGANALRLVCADASGQSHAQTLTVRRIVGAGPQVLVTSPANAFRQIAAGLTVTGTVSDPAARLTLNGLSVPVNAGTGAFTAQTTLVEGPNVLYLRAVDAAGRAGDARLVVERDSLSPKVQVTSPTNGQRVGVPPGQPATLAVSGLVDLWSEPHLSSITAQVTAPSPLALVTATLDPASGAFLAAGVPLSSVAGAGTAQTVTVTATDTLGKSSVTQVQVYADASGPAVTLSTPADLARFGGAQPNVSVAGEAWGHDGAQVSVNGGTLDPALLTWGAPAADGRRAATFTTSVATPSTETAFGVVVRVEDRDGAFANVKRSLFRDGTAPFVVVDGEVLQIVPEDGSKTVDPNATLLVLFSEPVSIPSLSAANGVSLTRVGTTESVAGLFATSGNAVAFVPAAMLQRGQSYRFAVGTGVADTAGNPLAASKSVTFTVALEPTEVAPTLDPIPSLLCATTLTVKGSTVPSATVRVRDGDLAVTGNADGSGRFSVDIPLAGSGYHHLHVANVSQSGEGPSASALFRVDCSAPTVTSATFDRDGGRIAIAFSEAVSAASLTVGGPADAIRLSDGEDPSRTPHPATVSLDSSGTTATLQLQTGSGAWWQDKQVRLEVREPAADARGNKMTAPYETLFFPGASPGDLTGAFVSGEAYDDETGRPLDGVAVQLFASGAALPGSTSTPATALNTATTDGKGRFRMTGDVAAGRYALVLSKAGYTRAVRRLPLEPATGAVPFDSRLTPLSAAQSLSLSAGGTFESAMGFSGPQGAASTTAKLKLEVGANALTSTSLPAGVTALDVYLTPLSGQGLPELLPLGWTPLSAADVRLEVPASGGGGSSATPLPEGTATPFAANAVHLTLPLPLGVPGSTALVAARYDVVSGSWLSLDAPERTIGADGVERARVALVGPGAVAVVVADENAATRPPVIPTIAGQALTGASLPSTLPALTGTIALDPLVVAPTGRSTAKVIARSADGSTPWPSGLALSAFLDEKLILAANAGELYEAPFSADLVAYHAPLSAQEQGSSSQGAAGSIVFRVSPSPKAAQVLLDSGYENIRLYPFPEQLERGLILGPAGGTVTSPDGVELSLPEGALTSRTVVKGRLLSAQELATYSGGAGASAIAGYQLLAGVRVELTGATLARPATLRLPTPAGTPADATGDKRVVLTNWIDAPEDNRGAFARLVSRGDRLASSGTNPERLVFAPEPDTSNLPLEGVIREGVYLVLRANASIGYATGFVKAANGFGYAAARVTTPGLGTADLSLPGGRYTSVVSAGANKTLSAKHPTLDEQGTASIASLAAEAVASIDITVTPVPPSILSVQPPNNATNQPLGSVVRAQFSEALDPASVSASSIRVEVAGAGGTVTGIFINGTVALSPDHTAIVLTPSRPLPINVRLLCSFTGGARDAGGTPYSGALPYTWSFTTTNVAVTNSNIDPSKIRLLLPDASGTAQIIGEAGAIPSGWSVSADIDGPVICPSIATVTANSQGAFTYTVGCPPTVPVTIASKVYLRVLDSQGNVAANIRLGPFRTADGKGFVAVPGEKTTFTSADGLEVTVPAEAFETPRVVTVRKLDPATLGVPIDQGLQVGAYVELDFEGQASRSLRVRIPLPSGATVGKQAFAGQPIDTPWGRRLRFLSAGKVVEVGGVKHFSNLDGDRPGNPGGARAPQAGPGLFVQSPWCTNAKIPCGTVCPGMPAAPPGCNASLAVPAPPGCNACDCSDALCEVLEEFGSKGASAIVFSTVLEMGTMAGALLDDALSWPLQIINLKFAETFVFVPPPGNWSGHFLLPVVAGVPFDVVVRNGATGWLVAERSYTGIAVSGDIQDIGNVVISSPAPPRLLDASPFTVVHLPVKSVVSPSTLCETPLLGVRACYSAGGVTLSPVPRFPLAEDTQLSLVNLTQAPTSVLTEDVGPSGFSPLSLTTNPDDDLTLVVSPGDLDPDELDVLKLSFDHKVQSATGTLAKILDCGELPPLGSPSCTSSSPEVAATVELSPTNTQLWLKLDGRLSRGHRYELVLDPNQLRSQLPPNPPYEGPASLLFATRKQPQTLVAESGPGVLGDTDQARDVLKVGNVLLVASATGKLVALDTTKPPSGSPPRLQLPQLAALAGSGAEVRTLATDGHGRVFYSVLEGGSWAVKVARIEDFQRVSAGQSAPPPPECGTASPAGTPPASPPCGCALSPAFTNPTGLGCVNPALGGVKTALHIGAASALLGTEFLAYVGSLPQGLPAKLDILVEDENPDGDSLPLADFYLQHAGSALSPADPDGYRTFTIDLSFRAPSQIQPFPRPSSCDETRFDRYRRVSVDNLATGQTWSFDLLDPSWGGPAGTQIASGLRAREGDELRIRYNQRTWGYLAIVGSGISVVDLNRFYRTPLPTTTTETASRTSQCGRRLSTYEGQELSGLPGDSALFYTTGIAALGQTEAGLLAGTLTADTSVDVYTPLHRFGAIRSTSVVQSPDLMEGGRQDLMSVVPGVRTWMKDVALYPNHVSLDSAGQKKLRDLGFYSLGAAGVLVYDLTYRTLDRYGRLGLPEGASVYKLQVDAEGDRLLGGGNVIRGGVQETAVFVWDITDPEGDPPTGKSDPRLLSVVKAAWDGGMAFDAATGLLYGWNGGSDPTSPKGMGAIPLAEPRIHAYARLRGAAGQSVYERTERVAPLGVPIRATRDEELPLSGVPGVATNADDDDTQLSAAFKLRVALPAGLGEELTAKVQSLRKLPPERLLGKKDVGRFVGMPGGQAWGKSEVYVTLHRLATPTGVNGPLSSAGVLYESRQTVVVLADPRAREDYTLQDVPGTEADEKGQCRRCKRPAHLPQGASPPAEPSVELLATGRYLRMLLAEDPDSPPSSPARQATQDAVAFFESVGDDYRVPFGILEVTGWAAPVPAPTQMGGAEPILNPAVYPLEADASVLLTSGEAVLETVDHQVPGRELGFALDRSYRSNLLGYGPLGAAGFTSSLFAELRQVPLFGRSCGGKYSQTGILVQLHDGEGHLYRMIAPTSSCPMACPSGFEKDTGADTCLEKGLYMRLVAEDGNLRLYGTGFDSLVFDDKGQLVEVRDRLRRDAKKPDAQGSTLLLHRDPSGQLSEVEDELGRTYSFEFDDEPYDAQGKVNPGFGLLSKVIDRADGTPSARRTLEYVFDTSGKRLLQEVRYPEVKLLVSGGGTTLATPKLTYAYDPQPTGPDTPLHGGAGGFGAIRVKGYTLPGASAERVSFTYDPATGRVTEALAGGSVKWTLASAATAAPVQTVTVTEPAGLVTEFQLKDQSATQPDGRVHVTTERDVPVTEVLPAVSTSTRNVTTSYQYLADGRLSQMTKADGSVTDYAYPTGDRLSLLNVTSVSRTASGATITKGFGYTGENVPTGLTNDGEGRSVSVAVPDIDQLTNTPSGFSDGATSKTDFDKHGRMLKVDTGGGAIVSDATAYYPDAKRRQGKGFVQTLGQGPLFSTLGYDARGNLARKDTSQGVSTTIDLDEWDRPWRETVTPTLATPGAQVSYGYDEAGHLVLERRKKTYATSLSVTATQDVETRYTYDAREQITRIEEDGVADPATIGASSSQGQAITTLQYHPTKGTLLQVTRKATSPSDLVTEYEHDVAGRLVKETVLGPGATTPPGPTLRGYDLVGRLVYLTDGDTTAGKLGEWKGVYDGFDRLTTQVLPTGARVEATYDNADGLKTVRALSSTGTVLAEANTIQVTSFGEVAKLTENQGGQTRTLVKAFDTAGRVKAVTEGGRLEESYDYEPTSGRLTAKKTPTREMRYGYTGGSPFASAVQEGEAATGPTCGVFSPSQSTQVTRDHEGRPLVEARNDGTVTTYTWDEEGRPLVVRQGSEFQVLSWDSASRLTRLERPPGRGQSQFRYDLDGRLLEKRDVLLGTPETTTAAYDAAGRLVSMTRPDTGTESYEYYPDDELKKVVKSDGVTLDLTYDRANLPETVIPTQTGGGAPSRAVLDGGVRFVYDQLARLLKVERLPSATGATSGVDAEMQGHDLAGRPRLEKVGSRSPIERVYDVFGRATQTTLPSGSTFTRTFEACTPRMTGVSGPGLGASWAFDGGRLLGVTTSGPRKVAHRFGYAQGPGAQVPGASPASDRYRLATLTMGTAGASDPIADAASPLGSSQAPGSYPWGQLAFGYTAAEGAKLGRKVQAAPSIGAGTLAAPSLVAQMGFSYQADAARRLTTAYLGDGSLTGAASLTPQDPSVSVAFGYTYGKADQLLSEVRQAPGLSPRTLQLTQGPDGRPQSVSIDSLTTPITYDVGASRNEGRRQEDDRHLYEWYWHGKLAKVTAKPGTPNAGDTVGYLYDGLGRLFSREHHDAQGQLQDRREYVYDGQRLVEESSYSDATPTSLRWRKTYLPGQTEVDTAEVKVDRYLPGNATPTSSSTYAFLRDEQGSVVALVEETAPQTTPLRQRYLYTPYGEAHVETGPELLRATFDQATTSIPSGSQNVALGYLQGALRLRLSLSLDPTSLTGITVERRLTSGQWGALLSSELALSPGARDDEALVLPLQGWELGTTYRIATTGALKDAFGRSAVPADLQMVMPPAPPPNSQTAISHSFDKSFPIEFGNVPALLAGNALLFQGLYHDDVTGLAYTDGRWYDAVTASWLSRDEEPSDSPSLYAFVKGRPHELVDLTGEAGESPEDRLAAETAGEDDGDASLAVSAANQERLDTLGEQPADITCLSSDTLVFTPEGYEPIESLKVGDRVLTPETLESLEAPGLETITESGRRAALRREDLRLVSLTLTSPDLPGSVVAIETLVPAAEVEAEGLHVGATVPLDAEGLTGEHAEVVAIEPAPPLSERPGRLVTSTFRHVRKGALKVVLEAAGAARSGAGAGTGAGTAGATETGEALEPIYVTKEHPFYVDGQGWRKLGELSVGSCVTTTEGDEVRIASMEKVEGDLVLCNIEVEGEHAFFAGSERVLVHNASLLGTLFKEERVVQRVGAAGTRIAQKAGRVLLTAGGALKKGAAAAKAVVKPAGSAIKLTAKQSKELKVLRAEAQALREWSRTESRIAKAAGESHFGTYLHKLGERTEALADKVLKVFPEVRELDRNVRFFKDPSKKLNYDRMLGIADLVVDLEIKSGLSGEALRRGAKQVRQLSRLSRGGERFTAIWSLRPPSPYELRKYREAVGPSAWKNVKRFHGVDGLLELVAEARRLAER